jgi:hypothetical protein
MIGMNIHLEGDGAWPQMHDRPLIHMANDAPPIRVMVLDGGLTSGRPSVAIGVELPDGSNLVVETTARLFCAAAKAIMAKYPDLFADH